MFSCAYPTGNRLPNRSGSDYYDYIIHFCILLACSAISGLEQLRVNRIAVITFELQHTCIGWPMG